MRKTLYILVLVSFASQLKGDDSTNHEVLYMFFHQQIDTKELNKCLSQVAVFKPTNFRPVFIAKSFDDSLEEDLIKIAEVMEKNLGQCDLFIFDKDGLDLLFSLKIKRLPAFAYISGEKVHTIEGCGDLTELKKCRD